jgi:RNA polymerase sigma factor (TIGR02999 family)
MSDPPDVTQLLAAWGTGDREALNLLMPVVMQELKRIAAGYLAREPKGHTLQTTALVNEAYLKLVRVHSSTWESRAQFFALAAQIMRRILVDHARARRGPQRGGGVAHVPLEPDVSAGAVSPHRLLALDDALLTLEKRDARKGRVVELRIFGGLSNEEVAHVLGISERTAFREWQFAKAWLARELNRPVPGQD